MIHASIFSRPWRTLAAATCLPLAFAGAPAAAQSFESGPYLGLSLGGGQIKDTVGSHPDWRYEDPDEWDSPDPLNHSFKQSGMIGGLYGGYGWRMGQWLLGIEGDLSGSAIKHTKSEHEPATGGDLHFKYRMPWLVTLRPRVGFLVSDSAMVYGTAGLAIGKVKMSLNGYEVDPDDGSVFAPDYSRSDTLKGWVVGAGFEYAMSRNWHLRGEYLHVRFKSQDFDFTYVDEGETNYHTGSYRPKMDLFRVGLSYQF
ncbi:outer membrane protein [Castellaniella hirudinis]|uniref:Outer membrane protein n=1 Tax=Castellaniella hirudinis TaxID=1144617 RepID=A0ABV8S4J4_9BURK